MWRVEGELTAGRSANSETVRGMRAGTVLLVAPTTTAFSGLFSFTMTAARSWEREVRTEL